MRKLTEQDRIFALHFIDDLCRNGLNVAVGHRQITEVLDNAQDLLEFSYSFGATKWVVMPKGLEHWVIKFSDNEHCRVELENYIQAQMDGYDCYFPTTIPLEDNDDWTFILSEKCDCDSFSLANDLSYSLVEEGSFDCYQDAHSYVNWGIEDEEVLDMIFHDADFTSWLQRHDINDCHTGNFGILNNNFVIIDFSGYYD